MNIENMTDEQKSVMLAKLMGWRIHDVGSTLGGLLICISESEKATNLYTPANMALAWRLICWLCDPKNDPLFVWFNEKDRPRYNAGLSWRVWWSANNHEFFHENAQRLWLDKILSLAIEAGMVGETS